MYKNSIYNNMDSVPAFLHPTVSFFSTCVSRRSLPLSSSCPPRSHRTAPQSRARHRSPVRLSRPTLPALTPDRCNGRVRALLLCPCQQCRGRGPIPPHLDPRNHHRKRYQCPFKIPEHSVSDSQHFSKRLPTGLPRGKLDKLYLSIVRPRLLVVLFNLHHPKDRGPPARFCRSSRGTAPALAWTPLTQP